MAKLKCTPDELNPRCGETVKVRIDTDPVQANLVIEALPDRGSVTVSPDSATTDSAGVAAFTIQCENIRASCETANVSFAANGYDSIELSVFCHPFTSPVASSMVAELNEVRFLLADAQGRLGVVTRLNGLRTAPLQINVSDIELPGGTKPSDCGDD